MAKVLVRQVRSTARTSAAHRGTIRALGLGRIRQEAVHEDSPALRGMLRKVAALVTVEEVKEK